MPRMNSTLLVYRRLWQISQDCITTAGGERSPAASRTALRRFETRLASLDAYPVAGGPPTDVPRSSAIASKDSSRRRRPALLLSMLSSHDLGVVECPRFRGHLRAFVERRWLGGEKCLGPDRRIHGSFVGRRSS